MLWIYDGQEARRARARDKTMALAEGAMSEDIFLIGRAIHTSKGLFIQCYLGRPHDNGKAKETDQSLAQSPSPLQPGLASQVPRYRKGQMAKRQRRHPGHPCKDKSAGEGAA